MRQHWNERTSQRVESSERKPIARQSAEISTVVSENYRAAFAGFHSSLRRSYRRTTKGDRPQTRRKIGRRKQRIECSGTATTITTSWVWRLLVASFVATSTAPTGGIKTSNGFFPVCDAFVVPMKKSSNVILRPERWTIPKIRNQKNDDNDPTTYSRTTDANVSTKKKTGLSSNSAISGNDTTDTASKNHSNRNRDQNDSEVAGLILAVAVILTLAGMAGTGAGVVGDVSSSRSVAVVTKVVENTVPTTSTEVVAVTLGESIGGVIGAIFSVAINFVLRGGEKKDDLSELSDKSNGANRKRSTKSSLLSQGLSDGDFFIANSASNSILEAVGVPESVAKYGSILIAAIPSQLVKIGSSISEQKRAKEEQRFNQLLSEEREQKGKKNNKRFVNRKELVPSALTGGAVAADATALAAAPVFEIDFVEVFADVTRWLEYDVLKTEYGEVASSQLWMQNNNAPINDIQSAITFALLGSLAAVSSRWYADFLYARFCYGPIEKQQEVRTRNNAEWFSLYSSTAASAAALFGCYEFFQLPIGRYIQGTLAGGVEGCFGSSRFDACMQTYIDTNSPGPTPEAQLRALITNLYAVYIRLQDIAGDTTWDDVSVLIRAWSVSFASFMANLQ
mmetsp:Transcript_11095/g.23571  ORF Transcript_11095/g.23571 Transcript_11095/m.23571 type:complete len:622 (+) Transcript_11095:133-1998(+)